MPQASGLGDFEQLVLLAILNLGDDARAAAIRSRIETAAHRGVSRGALYATLDRLEAKGYLEWEVEETAPARGGIPSRRFAITRPGLEALQRSWNAVRSLSSGLERILGGGQA
jgi:DNA-binding PadR family transcriptional regulator